MPNNHGARQCLTCPWSPFRKNLSRELGLCLAPGGRDTGSDLQQLKTRAVRSGDSCVTAEFKNTKFKLAELATKTCVARAR